MSWRGSSGFSIALSVYALGFVAVPARADEAYLCGPDKVVYVAVADLEMKKRTDPCIAAYYGLKIEEPVKSAPAVAIDIAKPIRGLAAKAVVADLKPLSDTEIPERATHRLERQAALEAPRAAPGTDFRNVKILNAAPAEDGWFHHTK